MNSLFGLSMDTIMAWTLSLFLIVTGVVAILALRNRLLFKLGLRNVPRRRAQTALIIVGLMLSTVIITSAFGTGDTVSYSIRSSALANLGPIDETVGSSASDAFGGLANGRTLLPASLVARVDGALARDPEVDGVTGALVQGASLQDLTSGQTKNRGALVGIPAGYPPSFGPLTTVDGRPVSLGALGAGEVYLNKRAADALNAQAGHILHVYVGSRPATLTVRAILRNENLAAGGLLSNGNQSDPTLLLPLDRAQRLTGNPGEVSTILISNRGDTLGGARFSDRVTSSLRALLADPGRVSAARTLLLSPAGARALQAALADQANGGSKPKLLALQRELRAPRPGAALKAALSDPAVMSALRGVKGPMAAPLNDALVSISDYNVQPLKQEGLVAADRFGSVFTSVFVVFGLFSISAGIMLIFLIFVMLAAERRAEMGMARAVGTKRRQLIQQFLFEGYVYDLGAALVGVALGIVVGLGMVTIMSSLLGAADFTLTSHVEPRSVIVAFCLGALVTFVTVAVSSWRVSRLNIVAAIRDLPEDFGAGKALRDALDRSWTELKTAPARYRGSRAGQLRIVAVAALALATRHPLDILLFPAVLIAWYARHLLLALVARGPVLLLAGFPLAAQGIQSLSVFLFSVGVSLLLIGAAMLIRWLLVAARVADPIRNRLGYSLAGLGLVVYWLLPFDALEHLGVPHMDGGIEMFFVSGLMLVMGGVWTVMYNSDLILGALLRAFGSRRGLAPILKTAVTYPMQHRFRTGMTLAMFSLVIFTLMVMSVLTRSTAGALSLPRDTGNYQIYGAVNPSTPIGDARTAIAADPALRGRIVAAGGIGKVGVGLRQPGQAVQSWTPYTANVLDDAYLRSTAFTLHTRAAGYGSDAQVWQTLAARPGYAVVDSMLVKQKDSGGFANAAPFQISGFYYGDTAFRAPTIEMRDGAGGRVLRLTVIGVLDQRAGNLDQLTPGVYTGERTYTAAGLAPVPPTTYVFRTAPNANVHALALALGRAFLRNGLDVKEVRHEYDTNQSINIGLNNLLQAFMALGLVVGIAALGVVATRSVVERRQQIGMLRAIGFKRSMIRSTFLLESSFVSILGTLLGVGLGLVLARNLVASIAKNDSGITLIVPWTQVGLIVAIAYGASLLTTWLPAWQASRVYPAEALRYE